MSNRKDNKQGTFYFQPFSDKQMKILTCWQDNSPVQDKFMVVADGSIRSGKTVVMSLSFVLFVMNNFSDMNAAICGKSVGTVRRNIIPTLKQMLLTIGYECIDHRSENYLEIKYDNKVNYFFIFGAANESSQDMIQGLTLCALYIDEVVLINKSFYYQALGRLSVDGAKCFVNCNPNSPYHWFYKEVLQKLEDNDGLYLHFTMKDNLSLSDEVRNRYEKMFSGVFYDRNILGKWVVADGLIYTMFDKNVNIVKANKVPYEDIIQWAIGVDYGTQNATVFLLMGKTYDDSVYVCKEYYYSGRDEAEKQGTPDVQKTDQEYTEDLRKFIEDVYDLTGKTYRDIPIVIDPSAASFKLNVRRFHMKTKNADNEVMDGIRTVATMMGEQRLFVSDECKETIASIYSYVWDSTKQLRGIDAPLKNDTDHCCDALRYGCMYFANKNLMANRAFNVGW